MFERDINFPKKSHKIHHNAIEVDKVRRSTSKSPLNQQWAQSESGSHAELLYVMPKTNNILVVHGPNLNLLGAREPELYGATTLAAINQKLVIRARSAGVRLTDYQSNVEGELVSCIQQSQADGVDFIIINPAAFTHTSIAMRDALAAVRIPFIEVHLSNVFAREAFRRRSYFSDLAVGIISGLGGKGYELALEYALQHSATEK